MIRNYIERSQIQFYRDKLQLDFPCHQNKEKAIWTGENINKDNSCHYFPGPRVQDDFALAWGFIYAKELSHFNMWSSS